MSFLFSLFEWITYVGLSVLLGNMVLQYIPQSKKPTIKLSKRWLIASAIAIAIFSVGTMLEIVIAFSKIRGVGETLTTVLLSTKTGHAWIMIVLLAILVILTVILDSHHHIYTSLTIGLVLAISYASHAASLSPLFGMLSHSLHVISVGLWAGVVLIVAFFTRQADNWSVFLKWFTPFAISCFLFLSLSGLIVMVIIVGLANYVNAWATDYGQSLLLKHITIIPLLAFAVINGILMKKVSNQSDYHPLSWIKAESATLLMIFFFTAVMVNQSPPTDLSHLGASSLLPFIYGQSVSLPLTFNLTIVSIIFLFIALLFFVYVFINFYKKTNAWIGFLSSGLFVFAFYVAMILSIQF
ncbi:hypothetical protein FZC66_07630 [Priestia megaterium]|nr:hypothetical protein FZC66_07630 [Priestia megaterium]